LVRHGVIPAVTVAQIVEGAVPHEASGGPWRGWEGVKVVSGVCSSRDYRMRLEVDPMGVITDEAVERDSLVREGVGLLPLWVDRVVASDLGVPAVSRSLAMTYRDRTTTR
jgi:hypothetical protein